jgi:hypothetical protein
MRAFTRASICFDAEKIFYLLPQRLGVKTNTKRTRGSCWIARALSCCDDAGQLHFPSPFRAQTHSLACLHPPPLRTVAQYTQVKCNGPLFHSTTHASSSCADPSTRGSEPPKFTRRCESRTTALPKPITELYLSRRVSNTTISTPEQCAHAARTQAR